MGEGIYWGDDFMMCMDKSPERNIINCGENYDWGTASGGL